MFFSLSALLMRRKQIIGKLRQCGAVTEAAAVTLADAGVWGPNAFPWLIERLIREGILARTADGRYYLL